MRHRLTLGIVLAVAFMLATPAYAASFDVDTFVDSADPAFQACTVALNDCSLRGAIITANAAAGPDTINVPAGLYELAIVGSDDNAQAGDLDVTEDLTLIAQGGTATVDASLLTNGDRSIHITGGGAIVVEIYQMTISGGESISGAGIQVDTGTLNLYDCIVEDNDAMSNSGGGIYNASTTSLYNTTVQNNHVVQDGAGILNDTDATLLVVDSTIQSNISDRDGGGIHSRGTVTLILSTVTNNTAAWSGGGIMTWGDLQVHESTISLNTANGNAGVPQGGGGINAYTNGNLIAIEIKDSIVTANTAPAGYGGGVITFENVQLLVRDSEVSFNQALYGGAMYLYGQITIEQSRIDSNTATNDGGGIWTGGGGTILLKGGEVVNNTAGGNGGGMWVADMTTTISQANFEDNTGVYGGAIYYLNAGIAPTPLTLLGATLRRNDAARGGGLYAFGGTAQLMGTGIYQNTATLSGGGINATDMEPMIIFRSTIAGNTSDGDGGGLYNAMWGTSSIISLSNSTVSSNISLGNGGGIANLFAPLGAGLVAQVHLFNVTVAANDAIGGASDGLYTDAGQIQARNSIVGQQVTAGADCLAVGGGVINGVGNNLEEGASCGFALNGVFPGLDPLALNVPGMTRTHALQAASPAINAGPAGGCRGDLNGDGAPDVILNNDQRGVPRAGNCDLGAYEF